MDISEDTIWRTLTTILAGGFGYLVSAFRSTDRKIGDVAKDLNSHKIEVARDYVPRKDFSELQQNMDRRFDKFEQNLKESIKEQNQWLGRHFDALLGKDEPGK